MIPLFYSKKRELITRDNPGRSSDAFFHLFAKGAQVLNAGPRGGDSHMEQTGMVVGNFELTPKGDHLGVAHAFCDP